MMRHRPLGVARAAAALLVPAALLAAGCGLNVQSADLFELTRSGQGQTLTLVVNDSGTLRCNGGRARSISSAMLISARDLADNLGPDAARHLSIPTRPDDVSTFTIRMSQGTIRFPDRAGKTHHELAEAELFAVRAAALCGP